MLKNFNPTYYFDNVYMVNSDFFKKEGIKNIILDIDNTLISNTVEVGDEKLYTWIDELKNAGINLCIVSNGKGARVKKFNENIGLPTVFEALKPTQKGYGEALKIMGANKEETVGIGDQIFTDIWGANRAGIKSMLVRPIDKYEQFGIKLKRVLEIPVKHSLKRRGIIK